MTKKQEMAILREVCKSLPSSRMLCIMIDDFNDEVIRLEMATVNSNISEIEVRCQVIKDKIFVNANDEGDDVEFELSDPKVFQKVADCMVSRLVAGLKIENRTSKDRIRRRLKVIQKIRERSKKRG